MTWLLVGFYNSNIFPQRVDISFFSKISITPFLNLSNWEWYKLGGIKFSQRDYYKIKGLLQSRWQPRQQKLRETEWLYYILKNSWCWLFLKYSVYLKVNSSKQKFKMKVPWYWVHLFIQHFAASFIFQFYILTYSIGFRTFDTRFLTIPLTTCNKVTNMLT